MSKAFRPWDLDEVWLFPASVQDFVPAIPWRRSAKSKGVVPWLLLAENLTGRRLFARAIHSYVTRMRRRDVMSVRDPAEAIEVLDRLLKFFGDGERWVKGRFSDRRGNRCLVGALDFVSSHYAMSGDAAEQYLADEISAAGDCHDATRDCARFRGSLRRALSGGRYRVSETVLRRDSLSDFNDGCKGFGELRALILQARAAAMNDVDAVPAARRSLDIESDEFVMA